MNTYLNRRKWKYIYILSLLFLIILQVVKGQIPNAESLLPSSFPLAPNKAALRNFSQNDVNLFLGVPDISIPIYTIKSGDIEIPIKLKYNASGIRINDVASWVGLGWSLETGPSISRQIMDRADDGTNGYFYNALQSPTHSFNDCNYDDNYYLELSVRGNGLDTEPDIYSYSVPRKSGKFFFNGQNDMTLRKIPYSPVKIQRIDDPLCFNIIDDMGNYYAFGKSSTSCDLVGGYPTNYGAGITAWNIDTIISQNKMDSIFYTYTTQEVIVDNLNSMVEIIEDLASYPPNCQVMPSSVDHWENTYSNPITESLSNEIKFKSGKVVFNKSDLGRSDLPNGYCLDNIVLFDYDFSKGIYTINKIIKFHYDYFVSNRLKLDSISFYNKSGLLTERYRFEYETTINLPERNSYSCDLWGYFNGKSNTTYMPPNQIVYKIDGVDVPYSFGQADRQSDNNSMQANILKKVYYPTGGYSEFEYEANRYNDGVIKLAGGLRIKNIKNYLHTGATPLIKTYVYGPGRKNFISTEFVYETLQHGYGYNEYCGDMFMQRRVFSAGSSLSVAQHDGPIIFYPEVTEYYGDGTNNTGKSEYIYTDATDQFNLIIESDFKQGRIDNYFFKRGQIKSISIFSMDPEGIYRPVTREQYQYGAFPDSTYTGVGFVVSQNYISYNVWESDCIYFDLFYSGFYNVPSGDNYMTSKTLKVYNQNDTSKYIVTTTNYNYDNFTHQQVSSITTVDSKEDTTTVLNKYAADYIPTGNSQTNNNILDGMINSNMHSSLIETYTKRGDDIISAQLNLYKLNGPNNTIVQDTIKILSIENPSQDFDTTYLNVQHELIYDSNYETYVNFDYYSNNNLKQYTSRNSPVISVLWGYNNQYPVAKILNSKADIIAYSGFETNTDKGGWTYTGNPVYSNESFTGKGAYQLSGNITKSISDTGKYILQVWAKSPVSVSGATSTDLFSSSANAEGWRYFEKEIHITSPSSTVTISGNTLIDELRLFPGDAQMITYTYEPNIGITSQSDENNIPKFYEYDSFGRLKYIKDQDRNILGKYDYHYQSNQ